MNRIIHSATYDSAAFRQFLQTPSGSSLVDYDTEEPAGTAYISTKEELMKKKAKGELGGLSFRTQGGDEWDHLIIELDNNPDLAKQQAEIIKKVFANPKYSYTKNAGSGRFTNISIDGHRQIFAEYHQKNGENHLHIASFRYAIDDKNNNVQQADDMTGKAVRQMWVERVNMEMAKAGLPLMSDFTSGITSENTVSSPYTQQQAREIVRNETTIEEALERATPVNRDTIGEQLDREMKELSKLMEQAKAKQENIQRLEKAKQVADHYNILLEENKKMKEEAERKEKEYLEKLAEAEITIDTVSNELAETKDKAANDILTKSAEIDALKEEAEATAKELAELDELFKDSEAQRLVSERLLAEEKERANNQQKTIDFLTNANIKAEETIKQNEKLYSIEKEDIKARLEQAQKEIADMNEKYKGMKDLESEKLRLAEKLEIMEKTLAETTEERKAYEKAVKEYKDNEWKIAEAAQKAMEKSEKLNTFAGKVATALDGYADFLSKVKDSLKNMTMKKQLSDTIENVSGMSSEIKDIVKEKDGDKLDEGKQKISEILSKDKNSLSQSEKDELTKNGMGGQIEQPEKKMTEAQKKIAEILKKKKEEMTEEEKGELARKGIEPPKPKKP